MVEPASGPIASVTNPAPKRSHKRKKTPPSLELDRAVADENFEDVLPSEEAIEDLSSDSFRWSDDEEEEFNVARPTLHGASRKRGWRSRISTRVRKRGRGANTGVSGFARKSRPHTIREQDVRGSQREKTTFKTERTDDREETQDKPAEISHDIYQFGAPRKSGWVTRHVATKSSNRKGKEKEAFNPDAAEDMDLRQDSIPFDISQKRLWKMRHTDLEGMKEGDTNETLQVASSAVQPMHERYDHEASQKRGANVKATNRLKRRSGGGHRKRL